MKEYNGYKLKPFKLIIDKDILERFIWEDHEAYHDDFEVVVDETIYEITRWHEQVSTIMKHIETGKYFDIIWSKAATEMQEHEYYTNEFDEVFSHTVTKIEYLTYEEMKKQRGEIDE